MAAGRDRRAAYRRGLAAETIAAWFLGLKGYRPLGRRFKAVGGEIDLVMRRGRLIAFIEVKARSSFAEALDAVDDQTARRIAVAAEIWLLRHPALADFDQRFDIVLVAPWRLPRHLRDAFRPPR
jgi:putative endonuclease